MSFVSTSDTLQPIDENHQCKDDSSRVVRFSADVATVYVTVDSLSDRWYGRDEYKSFQAEKRQTLRVFRIAQTKFGRMDETKFCLRGFEGHLSSRASQKKAIRRFSAVKTVMDEQKMQQRSHGHIVDFEALRIRCSKATRDSRKEAIAQANLDALEAMDVSPHSLPTCESPYPISINLTTPTSRPLRLNRTAPPTA